MNAELVLFSTWVAGLASTILYVQYICMCRFRYNTREQQYFTGIGKRQQWYAAIVLLKMNACDSNSRHFLDRFMAIPSLHVHTVHRSIFWLYRSCNSVGLRRIGILSSTTEHRKAILHKWFASNEETLLKSVVRSKSGGPLGRLFVAF